MLEWLCKKFKMKFAFSEFDFTQNQGTVSLILLGVFVASKPGDSFINKVYLLYLNCWSVILLMCANSARSS